MALIVVSVVLLMTTTTSPGWRAATIASSLAILTGYNPDHS
jgi:hypothetical protein